MNKRNRKGNKIIIFLAYMHRYGCFAALALALWLTSSKLVFGAGVVLYALWTLCGYRLKWKHIYCSYQNASHHKMTPNRMNWKEIKKSDAYGIPIFFFVGGTALILVDLLGI